MTDILLKRFNTLNSVFLRQEPHSAQTEYKEVTAPDIDIALKNGNGDILFGKTPSEWYFLPVQDGAPAYKLEHCAFKSEFDGCEVTFLNNIYSFKTDSTLFYKNGLGSLKFQSGETAPLKSLNSNEKEDLQGRLNDGSITCIDLPSSRKILHAFKTHKNENIIVSYGAKTDQFSMFIGPLDNLREIDVTDVQKFRDGGSFILNTPEGDLKYLIPNSRHEPSIWSGYVIEPLDIDLLSKTLGDKNPKIQGVKFISK